MSSKMKTGFHQPTLRDIVLKWRLESWDGSWTIETDKQADFVSLQWANAARDPCGHQFIHQAYKKDFHRQPSSSSTLAM